MKKKFDKMFVRRRAVVCSLLFLGCVFANVAEGALNDRLARFSTSGPDRYADGSIVVDGECYALVWSPAGRAFSGFNANGTAASAADRVVLAAPLALDGRCRDSVFQIPAAEYEALKGGKWSVCLVDTRNLAGVPVGVKNGKPLRVNRWGVVSGGVEITEAGSAGRKLAAASTTSNGSTSVASGARANRLSAVPKNLLPPKVTAIEVTDNEVWLAVDGTVPYLDYTIISGEKPNDLKEDCYSEVVEGHTGSEIAIGTTKWLKRRFFSVKRAE